jgi:hypothetical protein
MHLAACEHVCEYVTHDLAHTQLTLGEPSLGPGLTMARHIQVCQSVREDHKVRCTDSTRKHSMTSPTRMS